MLSVKEYLQNTLGEGGIILKGFMPIAFVLLIFSAVTVAKENRLTLSMVAGNPDQKVAADILKVAYSRLGIKLNILPMPGQRALQESSRGSTDGEVLRIYHIGDKFPSLIRIPTPINYFETVLFTKNHSINFESMQDLKQYRFGILRGVKNSEQIVKDMPKVEMASSLEALMLMLDSERVDFVVCARGNGLILLDKMNNHSIKAVSPPIKKVLTYHYLHHKHKELVPEISEIIKGMQMSKELTLLQEKFRAKHNH